MIFKKIKESIYFNIASKNYSKHNYNKAYKYFNKLHVINPNRFDSNVNLAITSFDLGNVEFAIELLLSALETDKNNIQANKYLAISYAKNENIEKALEICDFLIETYPLDYSVYEFKGDFFNQIDKSKAIDYLKKAIDIQPNNANLYFKLALIQIWNKQFEDAVKNSILALEFDSKNVLTYNNYGFALINLGRYQEAKKILNEGLKISEVDAFTYNNRGFCHLMENDLVNAIKDFNKSLFLDAYNSYAYKNRALYYLKIEDKINAIKDLEKAKELGFFDLYGNEVNELIDSLTEQ